LFNDAKRFKQVLFNLIGNAIKFTFSGGIALSLSRKPRNQEIQVEVEDTGVGIKKEDLSKLFKFFGKINSTKDINRSGMGLGLTISKMLVERFGGDIGVRSLPGVGSTFYFTLPLTGQSNSESPSD
jgi:signal transduction histidine kinase